MFFRVDRKNKMAALASDWLRHFGFLLWNRWTEFSETWQGARSQRPLPSLCFLADRKNKMAALASDWLRHFDFISETADLNSTKLDTVRTRSQRPLLSLCFLGRSEKQDGRLGLWFAETFSTSTLKPLIGIQRNMTGRKISMSSTKFVFFRPIGKQDGRPGLWLAETFSTSSLKLLIGIQRNLRGSKISTSSTKFVFFGPIKKKNQDGRSGLWLAKTFFYFSSETAERNSTKPWQGARSQCPLPSLCFSGRSEKQDGRPGLWLAETFSTSPLKPLNRIQRNLTGSKIWTSSTKLVFFGRSEKQDGHPGLWLAEIFSTSPLKSLTGIQGNLTGSKISTSSTNFVFFGADRKTRWLPRLLIGWDILDFPSETAEGNSTKPYRKQDLNVLYRVCVFHGNEYTKMAALANLPKSGTLYLVARYLALWASCFRSDPDT